MYPIIFGVLIGLFIIFTLIRSITIFHFILSGATNLHNAMTKRVLRANILIFDSNPIGRIVTRFSRDLIVFDLIMPIQSNLTIQGFFRTASVVVIISIVNYWMIIVCVFCIAMMFFIVRKGTQVMLESQRRDSESRGPIHGILAMVINGLVSLRAADKIQYFRQDFISNLKFSTNASFCYVIANRWIGIRLDVLCCVFVVFISFFLLLLKGSVDGTLLVMSLQVASDVIFLFSLSFRMFAEIDNNMSSS